PPRARRPARRGLTPGVLPGEESAREREVRDVRDAQLAAERKHVLVVASPDDAVVVLEDCEPPEAHFLGNGVGFRKLLRREVRAPDRPGRARVDELVERAESLRDRRRGIRLV